MRRFASAIAIAMPLALLWPGSGFAAPPIAQEVAHEQPSAPPVRLVASGIEPMFDTIGREEGLPGDVTTDHQRAGRAAVRQRPAEEEGAGQGVVGREEARDDPSPVPFPDREGGPNS